MTRPTHETTSRLSDPYFTPASPRWAQVVLYVDFDGVLQHQAVYWHRRRGPYMHPVEAKDRVMFEWAHFLEEALLAFPDVRLILSSTWCVKPGYSKALRRLPEGLRAKFIGGTFHRRHHGADPWVLESFRTTPRAVQILNDVKRRQPAHWLALDDDIADWPDAWRSNLVACDGDTGLSSEKVRAELRHKLSTLMSLPSS